MSFIYVARIARPSSVHLLLGAAQSILHRTTNATALCELLTDDTLLVHRATYLLGSSSQRALGWERTN